MTAPKAPTARVAIVNARLLSPGEPERLVAVLVDGGRIVALHDPAPGVALPVDTQVDAQADTQVDAHMEVVDAGGGYVAPGFIDVHVHGGAGADFMDGTTEAAGTICRFHASGGTTGLLATTAAGSRAELTHALDVIAGARATGTGGAAILGAHLEGPYFAPGKHGCHLPEAIRPPLPDEYDALLGAHDGLVRWMTLAPEVDGALELIAALRARGAVAAAGHTNAAEPQIAAAIAAGLGHATHLFCAMSTITKAGPYRIPGLVEVALSSDELTTEVIADGHHLAPALLKLAARAKGPARLLLVTDAMRGAGMPDGTYTFGQPNGTPAIVEHGVARTVDNTGFASSTARAIDLVRTMVTAAGCSLIDAVQMASTTPAGALGLAHRKGRVQPGYDADLVVLDTDLAVAATIVAGELVYRRPVCRGEQRAPSLSGPWKP